MRTEKEGRKGFFGAFFLIVRFLLRPFFRMSDVPEEYPEPCVYICRHKNMEGPVHIAVNFLGRFRIWGLDAFVDRGSCFRQHYTYTFTERYRWPRFFAYTVAKLASYVVPAFLKSMRVLPVYRGSAKIVRTYRESISTLMNGDSLMIFPDVDYKSTEDEGVKFYDGFLLLDKFYRSKVGKPLKFVPLYVDAKKRRILRGDPIMFETEERDWPLASRKVLDGLILAIDGLSRAE